MLETFLAAKGQTIKKYIVQMLPHPVNALGMESPVIIDIIKKYAHARTHAHAHAHAHRAGVP
jgi:hypothetical protein